MTFDQRLELLVDAEVDSQRIHKIERLINNAHFAESKASITQIKYYADRHLDRIVPKSHTIKILGDKSMRSR
ncbi:hypothetical protein B5E79_08430 [Massilimicrobiota sp. An134]|nr:hypothetical protein B5E79_08430 [Massilimicrobiota sp. An134]